MADTLTTIPIASLNPDQAPDHGYVRAIVTLLWPYSMSTRQMSMLLAEPDFRLRRKRGQVRVQISGVCAQELARTHVGIGDEVLLSLEGGSWREPTNLSVQTPGRSVESDLYFGRQLDLQLTRDSEPFAHVRVKDTAGDNESRSSSPDVSTMATPARLYAGDLHRDRVHTPVFHKRARISSGSPVDSPYDPFMAEESEHDTRDRKRVRRSWGSAAKWRVTREISPPGGPLAVQVDHPDGFMDIDDSLPSTETTAEIATEPRQDTSVSLSNGNDETVDGQITLPTPTRKPIQARDHVTSRFQVFTESPIATSEASRTGFSPSILNPTVVDETPVAQDDLYREATPPDLRASTSSQKHVRFSMGEPEVFESSPRSAASQLSDLDTDERTSPEVESPEEESDSEPLAVDDFEIEEVEEVEVEEDTMLQSQAASDAIGQRPLNLPIPILAPPPPPIRNEMPPPPLPTIRTANLESEISATGATTSGSPRTPDLQPVLSASLPLPSPFPGDDLTNPYLIAPSTPLAMSTIAPTSLSTPTRSNDFSSPSQTSPAGMIPDWMFQFGFGAGTDELPEKDAEMESATVELEAPIVDVQDQGTDAHPESIPDLPVPAIVPDTMETGMSDFSTPMPASHTANLLLDTSIDALNDEVQMLQSTEPLEAEPERSEPSTTATASLPLTGVATETIVVPTHEVVMIDVMPEPLNPIVSEPLDTLPTNTALFIDAQSVLPTSPQSAPASDTPIVIDLLGSSSDVEEESDDEEDGKSQDDGEESEEGGNGSEDEDMDGELIYSKDSVRLPSLDPFQERSHDEDEDKGGDDEDEIDEDENRDDSEAEDHGDLVTGCYSNDNSYKPSDNQIIDPSLSFVSVMPGSESLMTIAAPDFPSQDAQSSIQSMLRTEVDVPDGFITELNSQHTATLDLEPDVISSYEAASQTEDNNLETKGEVIIAADNAMPTRHAIYDEIDEAVGDVPRRRRHDRTPSIANSSRPSTASSPRVLFGLDGAAPSTPRNARRRSSASENDDIRIFEDETATPPAAIRAAADTLEVMTGEPLSTQTASSAPLSITADDVGVQLNMDEEAADEELLPLYVGETDESEIDEATHVYSTVMYEDSDSVQYSELPADEDAAMDEADSGIDYIQATRNSEDGQTSIASNASFSSVNAQKQTLSYDALPETTDGMDVDTDDEYIRVVPPAQPNDLQVLVPQETRVLDDAPPTPDATQRQEAAQEVRNQDSIRSIGILPPTPQMTQSDMADSFASINDITVDSEPPSFPDSAIHAIVDPQALYVDENVDQPMTAPFDAELDDGRLQERKVFDQSAREPDINRAVNEPTVSPSKSIFAKTRDLSSRLGNWFSPRKSKRETVAADDELSGQVETALEAAVHEDDDELHSGRVTAPPEQSSVGSPAKQSRTIIPDPHASASQEEIDFNNRVSQHMRASQASQTLLDSENFPSSQGLRTATSYYTPLASLPSKINTDSPFDTHVDCLAVVTKKTSAQKKAEKGPRDYYTILRVADRSIHQETNSSHSPNSVQVQIFRPWKAALPRAEVGDVVLLRNFQVLSQSISSSPAKASQLTSSQSPDSGLTLRSTETSSWCVWRFAHHTHDSASHRTRSHDKEGAFSAHEGKAIWELEGQGRDMAVVRIEEMNGPPVEFGSEERVVVVGLARWWSGISSGEVEGVEEMRGDVDDALGGRDALDDGLSQVSRASATRASPRKNKGKAKRRG